MWQHRSLSKSKKTIINKGTITILFLHWWRYHVASMYMPTMRGNKMHIIVLLELRESNGQSSKVPSSNLPHQCWNWWVQTMLLQWNLKQFGNTSYMWWYFMQNPSNHFLCYILAWSHRDHLYYGSNRHPKESKCNTCEPLLPCERVSVCKSTQIFNNTDLEEDCATYDSNKNIVLQDPFKDVYILHLSGANFIEYLQANDNQFYFNSSWHCKSSSLGYIV